MFKRTRLCLIGLLLAVLLAPLPASAQKPVSLSLVAAPLQDEKLLVVDIMVEDVIDLYGAEVQIHYDPTELRVQDANPRLDGVQVAPGTLLSANERFVVNNNVDTSAGTISFAATLLNPAPPVSGDGILATIAFEIVGAEATKVEFEKVQLVSSDLVSLEVETHDLELSGGARPGVIPPIVSPTNWRYWATGLVGLIAILLVLLVAVAIGRGTRTGRQSSTPAAVLQSAQPAGAGASQSSAALTEQGNRAVQRGDLKLAHEYFSRAVEQDPANADAWLGKGLVAEQAAEKRICFQRVLALDPGNPVARTELAQLAGTT